MTSLVAVLGQQGHVLWWQECVRAVLAFVFGLALVRMAGRRAFGKWAALDIIVSIIIGSNLSRALTGNAPFGGTLAATALLMAMHFFLAKLAAHLPRMSTIVEGVPVQLSHSGQLREAALAGQNISRHDLDEALRQSGVEDLRHTRLVMLEPSGKITVLKA